MPLGAPTADATKPGLAFRPVAYSSLGGWEADDHKAALAAFIRGAKALLSAEPSRSTAPAPPALLALCRLVASFDLAALSQTSAREFFETHFTPHSVAHEGPPGMLTGYYEPVLEGSRSESNVFRVPVLSRPPDLENLVAEQDRGAMAHGLTHARRTREGLVPYFTRREIEEGALAGKGLELVWLKDAVDCFFMHVQGSGAIRFADGSSARITYHGKNGHPYTSIGRYLIDEGHMTADEMSLDALKAWLSADQARGRELMWQNMSYVFFRELEGPEAESALGALHIPLSDGRSLAVDTAFHPLGTPLFVSAPTLTHADDTSDGFHRLMIAQDVGSAIRGPERGDIFFGSGSEAGARAGVTKHAARFTVLLPKGMPAE